MKNSFLLILTIFFVATLAHRRGGKNPPGFERPSFLKGLDQIKITEYHQILHDGKLTKKQFRSAVEQFALNLPTENKKLYTEWKEKHEKKHKEFETNFNSKISGLSKDAQELAKKIKMIHDNLDLTKNEEKEQIQKLRQNASDSVRKEIKGIFPGHGGHRGQRKHSKKVVLKVLKNWSFKISTFETPRFFSILFDFSKLVLISLFFYSQKLSKIPRFSAQIQKNAVTAKVIDASTRSSAKTVAVSLLSTNFSNF
uniref:SXP/RAL-2 family protein Ani s 5-like cation-binding domain-containing protein n=1 Tax=Panagrolaimus sp. JU765 TaxID=591449 RepID=A0AC34QMG6_9BILA